MKLLLQKIGTKILNIMKRVFDAYAICSNETYASEEEALKAALHTFTTWNDWEPLTQEEYEKLQRLLEEFEHQ